MRCFPVPLGSPEATETAKGKGPRPNGVLPRLPLLPLIASSYTQPLYPFTPGGRDES
jgi:hypothetical protein